MKENYFFKPLKEGIENNKKKDEIKPLTIAEYEDNEERPMTLKDSWLSLRQSIQEKIIIEKPTEEELERTMLMSELITPELMAEYRTITNSFNKKSEKTELHTERGFIDINNEEFSKNIEKWIENLIKEVKNKKEVGLNENNTEELRQQSWLLFDAMANVINTKSLEKDITLFYKQKGLGDKDEEEEKQKIILINDLQKRYPLDKTEIGILVDLVTAKKGDSEYSLKILVDTITRLWKENNLNEKKGTIAKISLGYLLSKGASSFAPSLYQNMFVNNSFDLSVFVETFILDKFSDVVNMSTNVELAKMMNDVNHQINERMTNSLFFQEFEFIHEKSLGEIYTNLGRGKNAASGLLSDTISNFAPTLTGIVMSLGFLTKINPFLGTIGVGSLPLMYIIAKKQNEKIKPMYEKIKREREKIATQIGSMKEGFEEIKTSPETPHIAGNVTEKMNALDTLDLNKFIKERRMDLVRMVPFDISNLVAASVGSAFHQAGMIPGGAVLSNIIYSNQLNLPIQRLVGLYFNRFSRYIQDIERMEEIFGKYDKLDLPEGEKEKDRVGVSSLENFDISIKNLKYKDILKGVSLDIKQGEFVTIAGASGAGKSTLLRNLVGLYKSDSGSIEIGGVKNDQIKKFGKESLYSAMSYCNQNPQIFKGMTLRENILLWSKNEVGDEKIKSVLQILKLDKFINKLDDEAKHFSGGEKVRIGLARTLVKGAKIMLLDEPTASLDSRAANEVRNIIAEINKKFPDITIVCVSHDDKLMKKSKRVIELEELQQK